MQRIAVVTGGAGGMGLATARVLGRDHALVITDLNQQKLDAAAASLRELGMHCDTLVCDVADARSVAAMARQAGARGEVAIGWSPRFGRATPNPMINGSRLRDPGVHRSRLHGSGMK